MVKRQKILGLMLALFVTVVVLVSANQEDFVGTWINVDSETDGLTKLVISKEDNNWKIQGWGKCHPADCDWGKIDLKLVGTSVSDKSFEHGFAVWEKDFATTYLNLKKDGKQLVVETITIFKDRSGRSSYRSLYIMRHK